MPTIHLMTGYIGFGKTTIAKELEKKLFAIRLTHDDIMLARYGRNSSDFQTKYKLVDDFIRSEAAKYIFQGRDVIFDYGLWTHRKRKEYYEFAKTLTDDVVFHSVCCDLDVAKDRVLNRTKNDVKTFVADENIFNRYLKIYEPWDRYDDYPVVWHNAPTTKYIGNVVKVKIDRPKGSKHPKYGFNYPINYGFIPYTKSGDGEELDVYVLAVNDPITEFEGRCIGVVHRTDEDDDKLVVVPKSVELKNEEIEKQIDFQEKWFKHILIRG